MACAVLMPLYIYPVSESTWKPLYDAYVYSILYLYLSTGPLPVLDSAYLPT